MGLLNSLFGFRWSLYVVRNKNECNYILHEHSVIELLHNVMVGYYSKGLSPVEPWSLNLVCNRKQHQKIKLEAAYFDGDNISPVLMSKIKAIDPGWDVRPGEPVFLEAGTKKKLKMSEHNYDHVQSIEEINRDIQRMMDNFGTNKPKEITFDSVMNMVFGRD
jgi:hypothetical protein